MKSEVKLYSYLSNFKNILKLLLFSNLIFLFTYNLYLHPIAIKIISTKESNTDLEYYKGIFGNLEYASIIVIMLLLLTLFRYEKIKNYFINTITKKNLLFFCIISNVTIQVLILLFITPEPISDSKYYIEQANLLYKSGSYINSSGNLTAFWPIGLPAYLAFLKLFSTNFIVIAKVLNILISTGLIIVCYYVFDNYLSRSTLNLFIIIFTFFPNNLLSANIILTDYPFTFFLWGSVLIMLKMHKKSSVLLPVLVGIFSAFTSFLRPIGIMLPFIFVRILLLKKYSSGRRNSLIILTVFLLIMLPWGIRNFNIFHSFIPVSTNGGYNFLMGNHIYSSGGVNFNFEYNLLNTDESDESRKAYDKAFNDILNNPLKSLIRIPKKILCTYYRGDSSVTWGFKQVEENINAIIISFVFYTTNLSFFLIILLNVYTIFSHRKRINARKYSELLAPSIYMLLIIIVFFGSERFHIPQLPIHIFLAAKYFELKSKSYSNDNSFSYSFPPKERY